VRIRGQELSVGALGVAVRRSWKWKLNGVQEVKSEGLAMLSDRKCIRGGIFGDPGIALGR
jgi:hypothetical protein